MAWSFSETESAEKVIEEIKEGKISNKATAYSLLNQIINDFSDSYLAEVAKQLKDEISE